MSSVTKDKFVVILVMLSLDKGHYISDYDEYDYWKVYLEAGKYYKIAIDNFDEIYSSSTLVYLVPPLGVRNNIGFTIRDKVDLNGFNYLLYKPDASGYYSILFDNYMEEPIEYNLSVSEHQRQTQSITGVESIVYIPDTYGTYQLNAKAITELSYTSSNQSVADVSYDGQIYAWKNGTTDITITAKDTEEYIGATKVVRVVVGSTAPTPTPTPVPNTKTTVVGYYNSVKGADIRWREVPGCTGYIVYRYRQAEGEKKVETINSPYILQCYDEAIKTGCWGRVYTYYVSPIYGTKEGPKSEKITLQRLAPMRFIKYINNASGKVFLSWACTVNDNKAYGYEVQYATSTSDLYNQRGSFRKVSVEGRNSLSRTLSGFSKGKTYYFRIRCYVNYTHSVTGKQTKTWSQYGDVVSVKITK